MASVNKWRLPSREGGSQIPPSPFEDEFRNSLWDEVWEHEHILPSMRTIIEQYIDAVYEEKVITKSIREGKFPLFEPNARGGVRKHPALLMQSQARERIEGLQESLALTPKALSRLNNAAIGEEASPLEEVIRGIAAGRKVNKE